MALFTGVSVITYANECTTSAVDTDTDSGYHLLVVKDYSKIVKAALVGDDIRSEPFMIGGLKWRIFYYPKGANLNCKDFISFYICPGGEDEETEDTVEVEETVEVKFQLSFVDQVEYQKPVHIRRTKTYNLHGSFGACNKFMRRDVFERSVHLKDDSFTIRCDIMVCKDFSSHDVDGTVSEIHDHFYDLLENKVGADVTFEVSGETFHAHRCVLAARSKVFMALLFGPMAEGTMTSAIKIEDMEANVFATLLRFIYTDTLPEVAKENNMEEEGQTEEGNDEHVMWLEDLLVAADRYDLQRLKFLCESKLSEHIGVNSVSSNLALAEQLRCHKLKKVCLKFIQVQSPDCLDELIATEDWKHMILTYPYILNAPVAKLVSSNQKKSKKRKNKKRKTPLPTGSG